MKRLLIEVLVLMLIFVNIAVADSSKVDISGLSIAQLIQLKTEIDNEILNQNGFVIMEAGQYVAGRDIGVGSYLFTPRQFSEGEAHNSRYKIRVWKSIEAKQNYDTTIVYSASNSPIIDEMLFCNDALRITLEEDQLLVVEYRERDNITLALTVEKVNGLFMD